MPRVGSAIMVAPPTKVGLRPLSDATNGTNVGSIAATSTQRSQAGKSQSTVAEAAR